jgi:hypothetical protein
MSIAADDNGDPFSWVSADHCLDDARCGRMYGDPALVTPWTISGEPHQ